MGVQPGLQFSSLLPAIQPTAPATSLYLEFSSPTAGTTSGLTCTPVGWGFVQLCELSHCDPSCSDGSPRVNLGSATQQASSLGMRDWSCFWGTVMLWMVVLELACLQPGLKGMSRLLQPTSPIAHNSNPRHAYSSAFMLAPGLAVLHTFSLWAMCVGSRIAFYKQNNLGRLKCRASWTSVVQLVGRRRKGWMGANGTDFPTEWVPGGNWQCLCVAQKGEGDLRGLMLNRSFKWVQPRGECSGMAVPKWGK